jgi:hypothetical protein
VSQWQPDRVWTEREGDVPGTPADEGDFEACVATSYVMGLLYGGVRMNAPYTQAERERLEVVTREPQDLRASDRKAKEVYGRVLRGPSVTTSKVAFLARPGLGYCLTGVGSPVGAQAGTFIHEVFAVAVSATTVRVYDPLLQGTSGPKDRSVQAIAAWMKGIAPHQVREVRRDEFSSGSAEEDALTEVTITLFADGPHTCAIPVGGTVEGWNLEGRQKSRAWPTGSSFQADAQVSIRQDPQKAPNGTFVRGIDGVYQRLYVPISQVSVGPPTNPPPDLAALKAELAETKAALADAKATIKALETNPVP